MRNSDQADPPLSRKEPVPGTRSEEEPFLARWSRLKRESRAAPPSAPRSGPPQPVEDKPPELPPLDSLTFDSDFRAFLHPKVEEGLRRAALKKLFSDPRFNVMDGLDVYIEDYNKFEPLEPELLAKLTHTVEHLVRSQTTEEGSMEAEARVQPGPELLPPSPAQPSASQVEGACEKAPCQEEEEEGGAPAASPPSEEQAQIPSGRA